MTLAQVTVWFKKGLIIFFGVAFVYYLSIFALIPLGRSFIEYAFSPKEPPTVAFGQLDPLEFVEKQILNPNPTYVLNTRDGRLPNLPRQVKVYRILPAQFSYQAGKNAQDDAEYFGFFDYDLITDLRGSIYRWRSAASGGILEIHIHNKNITINTPLAGKSAIFPAGEVNETTALSTATELLKDLERFDASYENGTQQIVLGRFQGQQVVETSALRDAQIARVDFFRSLDKIPILGPDPKKGLLHIIVKKPDSNDPVFSYPNGEVHFKEIDSVSDATYPLVPINHVWNEVSKGKGVISNVTPNDMSPFGEYRPVRVDRILINRIYIAYYENHTYHPHLQPIYVFDGNYTASGGGGGSITIYYPAVDGQYVKPVSSN
jgi:hypothetical protein